MQGVHCSVEVQHRKGYECLVAGVIIHAYFLKHALFSGRFEHSGTNFYNSNICLELGNNFTFSSPKYTYFLTAVAKECTLTFT